MEKKKQKEKELEDMRGIICNLSFHTGMLMGLLHKELGDDVLKFKEPLDKIEELLSKAANN